MISTWCREVVPGRRLSAEPTSAWPYQRPQFKLLNKQVRYRLRPGVFRARRFDQRPEGKGMIKCRGSSMGIGTWKRKRLSNLKME